MGLETARVLREYSIKTALTLESMVDENSTEMASVQWMSMA